MEAEACGQHVRMCTHRIATHCATNHTCTRVSVSMYVCGVCLYLWWLYECVHVYDLQMFQFACIYVCVYVCVHMCVCEASNERGSESVCICICVCVCVCECLLVVNLDAFYPRNLPALPRFGVLPPRRDHTLLERLHTPHTHTRTPTRTYVELFNHTHLPVAAQTHTPTHTQRHSLKRTHTNAQTNAHTFTHSNTRPYTREDTRTR